MAPPPIGEVGGVLCPHCVTVTCPSGTNSSSAYLRFFCKFSRDRWYCSEFRCEHNLRRIKLSCGFSEEIPKKFCIFSNH
jgi:hypothetical protein